MACSPLDEGRLVGHPALESIAALDRAFPPPRRKSALAMI
jgi:hypothetical protein